MFGLLRYDGKANGKQPERQKERTLEHGRIQNQIAANASEFFRKVINQKSYTDIGFPNYDVVTE
jgi:hypothetical protein